MFCKLIKIPKNRLKNAKNQKISLQGTERGEGRGRQQKRTLTKSVESRRVPGNRGDDSVRELTEAPTAPASEWNVSQEGYLVADSAALPIGIDYTLRRQKEREAKHKKRKETTNMSGKQIITSAVGKYVAATYQHNQQQIPGHA